MAATKNFSSYVDDIVDDTRSKYQIPFYEGVCVFEKSDVVFGGKRPIIQSRGLQPICNYDERFKALIKEGLSWINIELAGIHSNKLIIFVNYPDSKNAVPVGHTSIITKGPALDITSKLPLFELAYAFDIAVS